MSQRREPEPENIEIGDNSKATSFEEEAEQPFYEVTKSNAKKHSPPKDTTKNKNKEDSFMSACPSFMGLPTGRTTPKTTSASASAVTAAPAVAVASTNNSKKQQRTPSPRKNKGKSTTKDQFEDWMATISKEEQEEIMLQIVKANQQKKRDARRKLRQSDPSDPSDSSSSSSSDSDDDRTPKRTRKHYSKKHSDKQPSYRRQAFAAERLRNARPQKESEKYDGTVHMNYRKFKNRFMTFSDNKDINPLDVVNELPHWVAGPAKRLVEAFINLEDPREALRTIWQEMDKCYSQTRKTVSEMVSELSSKPQLKPGDVDGLMDLQTELQMLKTEAIIIRQTRELNDAHNVRNIVVKRLPDFMASKFYDDQADKRVDLGNPAYEKDFNDIQDMIGRKIQSLRARGMTGNHTETKQETRSTCAHSVELPQTKSTADVVRYRGPVEKPTEMTGCGFCQAGHPIQNCNKLKEMSRELRAETLKKGFFCFNRLKKGHRSVYCQQPHAKCDDCDGDHQTLLHGLTRFLATKNPATGTNQEKEQTSEGTDKSEQQEGENEEA